MRKIWFILPLIGSALGSANSADLPKALVISSVNAKAVLQHLGPALTSGGGACRIYYSTACEARDEGIPSPEVKARPSERKTGLSALRDIFGNDKRVKVSQDQSGMIRIMIGQPVSTLLRTRIHSLHFNVVEQYNGELAVWAVLNSKEVEAAMRGLGLSVPVIVFGGAVNVPEEGRSLRHLPASLNNVTADRALDVIARTFGGIVLYQTCSKGNGKGLVALDFVQVVDL